MKRSRLGEASIEEDYHEEEDDLISDGNEFGSEMDDGDSVSEEENDDGGGDEEKEGDERDEKGELEELEKEYHAIQSEQLTLLKGLKQQRDEDILKGQAVKNQQTLWNRSLEFRFLLQRAFSSSNKLPKEPHRSSFCHSDSSVSQAFSDLVLSAKQALSSLTQLQEALIEKNPSIVQGSNGESIDLENNDDDDDWLRVSKAQHRIVPYRNNAIDKWHRKTQVTTGAAAFKGKLHAFNQNISNQVATYMRDPNRMIKRMQLKRSSVGVFGEVSENASDVKEEDANTDGDAELIDDSEFYQQLLKEFFESCDLASSERAYYAVKRMHTKKRKVVDRRASKSRKIRYTVHEKIVNFMAPKPMKLNDMAAKLFDNLFGHRSQMPKIKS